MNINFPYRQSPASLTFNNYFYLFYITRITINNVTIYPKFPKNRNRRATLGWPPMKSKCVLGIGGGGFNLFAVDQLSSSVLPWLIRQNNYNESITIQYKNKPIKNTKHLFLPFLSPHTTKSRLYVGTPFVITLATSFIIQFRNNFTQVLGMTIPRTSQGISVYFLEKLYHHSSAFIY